MIELLFFSIHVVVPLLLILWLFLQPHRGKAELALHLVFTALATLFIFLWGQWPVVGSYALRFLAPVFFVVAAILSTRRFARVGPASGRRILSLVRSGIFVLFALLFGMLDVFGIRGLFLPGQPVELDFPLKSGTYYVSSGGASGVLNVHSKSPYPGMWYAIDVNRLGRFGQSSNGLFPSELDRHLIFDQKVTSPCSGLVTIAEDGSEDHPSGFLGPGADRTPANRVAIECQDVTVFLTHLKNGSVGVREGETVAKGQMIGRVGNSGFSEEPHLHVQAVRNANADPSEWVPVPITFSGRFLVKNSLVRSE